MNFELNFNLETSEERRDFLKTKNLRNLTPKEIELCANYILFGKDPNKDFTSCVDRKEVQIKTKFQTYSKKEPISLDALIESPSFNENMVSSRPKTIYKKVKPHIDKEKAKNIPGMEELWAEIAGLQNLIDQNLGKKEKEKDTPTLSSRDLYILKHQLVELRKQQYCLMDSEYQTMPPVQLRGQYFESITEVQMNYEVYPRGVMKSEKDKYFMNPRLDKSNFQVRDIQSEIREKKILRKPYFSFLDRDHVYQLVLFYWDIRDSIRNSPDSPLWGLIWTLDFYIEKANLSKQQKIIVEDKKLRASNKFISEHLKREVGKTHQENYISTIWNKVVLQITEAAQLNYDEWVNKDSRSCWKKCSCCKKEMLRDPRNFVKKSKALDGLTSRCKRCDKELRLARLESSG